MSINNKNKTSKYISDIAKEYSIYTCTNRAIPNVTDGLKDSQRKALWILTKQSGNIKTISLAGEMISSGLYLHGDASAADAIGKLAAPYLNNIPLIEGEGSFGTRVEPVDGIAAPRYTYVKKNVITERLMYPDLDIVPLVDNYDGSVKEPVTFLPIIPTVLLNGTDGIAVGWSTKIFPRNIQDIIRETKNAIQGKPVSNILPKYDYVDADVVSLGGGRIKVNGKVEIKDSSTVIVTELPPGLKLRKFREILNDMEDNQLIQSYVDNSAEFINVEIKFKRGFLKDKDVDFLIDFLKINETATENMVVLDWTSKVIVKYENESELITDFVKWRKDFYVKRYEKFNEDDSLELKYWQGVKACFVNKLPSKLQSMKTKADLIAEITSITVDLTDNQIENIAAFASYRWAKDYEKIVDDHIKRLTANIKTHTAILASQKKLDDIFIKELDELAKSFK